MTNEEYRDYDNPREELPIDIQFNLIENFFHHRIKHNLLTSHEEQFYYQFCLYANHINKGVAVSFYRSIYYI